VLILLEYNIYLYLYLYMSNYLDSGYDASGNGTTVTVPSTDIYNVTNICGVYKMNGDQTSGLNSLVGIPTTLEFASGLENVCDGYLLYPGWAFQIFNTSSGFPQTAAARSLIYYNDTQWGRVFTIGTAFSRDWFTGTSRTPITIRQANDTTNWAVGVSDSIRVWFRGSEVRSAWDPATIQGSAVDTIGGTITRLVSRL